MPATLSPEGQAIDFMQRRDCSAVFLGQFAALYNLSGLSQQRLSQAFSDAKPLDIQKGEELQSLIRDLDGFCHSVAPIPVLLRNPHQIKALVDDWREKNKAEKELPLTYVWVLRESAFRYFRTFINGNPIYTSNLRETAGFDRVEVANEAIKRLKALHVDVRSDSLTNTGHTQSTVVSDVSQLASVGL